MRVMKITRHNHHSYMVNVAPIITLLYFGLGWLAIEHTPSDLVREVVASVGLSLILLFVGLYLHDRFHQIWLYRNHIEIKFPPLKMQRELLYRNIQEVKVKQGRRKFADVIIELRDGSIICLHHVDDPHELQRILSDRRIG